MRRPGLPVLAAALLSGPAWPQDVGNPEFGAALAGRVCSVCHAIGPEDPVSPLPEAPPFSLIASDPAIGRTALLVWFRSSHPTMPNLKLTETEEHDLIAYILSLKP